MTFQDYRTGDQVRLYGGDTVVTVEKVTPNLLFYKWGSRLKRVRKAEVKPAAQSIIHGDRVGQTLRTAAIQHGVKMPQAYPRLTENDLHWVEARVAAWAKSLPVQQYEQPSV